MAAEERTHGTERDGLAAVRAALAEASGASCQAYHIDFFRCVIRKSFARPDVPGGTF